MWDCRTDLRARTRRAAELLVADLADPPSNAEICKEVGLSEFQLKKGFRQCFDTTVGAYLRAARMRRAAELLASEDFTVAAIAAGLGYANASRFAEAFRRHHGCNPSDFAESRCGG